MMFVHIDTKTGDDCVSIAVTPKMSAHELHSKALKKAAYSGDSSKFLLHEVILGGEMERVIHYNEVIYDVTLKWWQWAEEDRRNTYLLLKVNERSLYYDQQIKIINELTSPCRETHSSKRPSQPPCLPSQSSGRPCTGPTRRAPSSSVFSSA